MNLPELCKESEPKQTRDKPKDGFDCGGFYEYMDSRKSSAGLSLRILRRLGRAKRKPERIATQMVSIILGRVRPAST